MYYSSGNYEAFATPKKPEGIEGKSAYVVGTGLAGLAAACFLIRDAQMPGEHITLFEHLPVAGGSCDGIYDATKGFIMRGGREMDNHFECMWDLFKSIPSIVNPGETIFSEYYYLNKEDPNFSLCRVTEKQGQDAHTDRKYGLTPAPPRSCSSCSWRPTSPSRTRRSMTCLTMSSTPRTSGPTGRPCSRSRSGTAPLR